MKMPLFILLFIVILGILITEILGCSVPTNPPTLQITEQEFRYTPREEGGYNWESWIEVSTECSYHESYWFNTPPEEIPTLDLSGQTNGQLRLYTSGVAMVPPGSTWVAWWRVISGEDSEETRMEGVFE